MQDMLVITVLGLGTTFAVLLILWGCIEIMNRIVRAFTGSKEASPAAAPQPEPTVTPAPVQTAVQEEDEEELIAVLTAAVAASLNTSTYNLRIKSFRRTNAVSPAWNNAGRNELLEGRRIDY